MPFRSGAGKPVIYPETVTNKNFTSKLSLINQVKFNNKLESSRIKSASSSKRLVPISLTYFAHKEGDWLGWLLAMSCLSPIFIIVAQSTMLLVLMNKPSLLLLIGQLINEGLNLVLKHWFREKRPNVQNDFEENTTRQLGKYGMPSSHAQFMAFTAMCGGELLQTLGSKNFDHILLNNQWAIFASKIVLWIGISIVSYARLYLGAHTPRQIIVGVIVGLFIGHVWFSIINLII